MPRKSRRTVAMARVRRTLKQVFGLDEFRPGQEEVVRAVLDGRNTLAIMPTGAGKSLCYQLPAVILPGTTVVVSPLISLMKDQTERLDDLGVPVKQVNSALSSAEHAEAIAHIEGEQVEFVLVTPERLVTESFLETIRRNVIDLVVIDEAHCVSQWGHDFRPAYLELARAIQALGAPPVLALTATATEAVVGDIERHLDVGGFHVVNTGIYRPNLHYAVTPTVNEAAKQRAIVEFVRGTPGPGIVYTSTVKAAMAVTGLLEHAGVAVATYHGRATAKRRKEAQDSFMAGELQAIVATNAFGMGIDKADIRFVVHYNMPGSLEAYYQETGRAGRDGAVARCVLFYQHDDRRTHLYFMGGRYPSAHDIVATYRALERLGASQSPVTVAMLAAQTPGVAATKRRVMLSLLKELGIVAEARGTRFRLVQPGLGASRLEQIAAGYTERADPIVRGWSVW